MRPGCAPPPGTRLEEVKGRGQVPESLSPASLEPGLRPWASGFAQLTERISAPEAFPRPQRPFRTPETQASWEGPRPTSGGASSRGPREHQEATVRDAESRSPGFTLRL